ncbi:MAG TPA: hypothetical protein VK146_14995 [Tabrizicola sp.]|nr:hypothetical protein [Tabrizicola sp.]
MTAYSVWEYGKRGAPPPVFDRYVDDGETILWLATLPSQRFQQRLGWLCLVGIGMAMIGYLLVPWDQSMAEYCATDQSRSCRKFYILAWPMLGFGAWTTIFGAIQAWKSKARPWTIYLAVTTKRALWMDSRKPDKIRSADVKPNLARIDWAGITRFDKSKSALSFTGIDHQDARRAVYWANQGRFRTDLPLGAET